MGHSLLLKESADPASPYYNRIKGFGPSELDRLDEYLHLYPGNRPCLDMTPDHMKEEVAAALCSRGYVPAEQLVFLAKDLRGVPMKEESDFLIEQVTEHSAEEYVQWIGWSNGEEEIDRQRVDRVKEYFYRPDFVNLMIRVEHRPAAMGSLFFSGADAYLANDYTFPGFRGQGCQSALIRHRLAAAARQGAEMVFTDVEFGSASHRNMLKAGFQTVFLNTFWFRLSEEC